MAIRADASVEIGSGHVMRCLTLADELARHGAVVRFLVRDPGAGLVQLINDHGHGCTQLSTLPAAGDNRRADTAHAHWLAVSMDQDADEVAAVLADWGGADWLVVDHYALDARWESRLRRQARRILVLDDLADRAHDCDVLVDQNLPALSERYRQWLPVASRRLLGPDFALLRPEFAAARERLRYRDGVVRRIHIFFGGADADNLTGAAIEAAMQTVTSTMEVDVVIGAVNPYRKELESICARFPGIVVHHSVADMASLLQAADLAIGAAGTSTWERACLGVPALVLSVADNQRPIAKAAAERGILSWIGDGVSGARERIMRALAVALSTPNDLRAQTAAGLSLVDGQGATRVARAMQP